MARGRSRGRVVAAAGTILAAAALACLAALLLMRGGAAAPAPSPDVGAAEGQNAESLWPEVDWDYWRGVNPDVVGWISIPGTSVSQPVVQAHAEDPDYYLRHDVYGNWNVYGSIYLDAECEEGGLLGSRNAVVLGHHMSDGSMFAEVASYSDPAWAAEHAVVLVQTPSERAVYGVRYADVVPNSATAKRCDFLDATDFATWYEDGLANAAAVVDGDSRPTSCLSLVTCSYNYSSDERTVAVCSRDDAAGDALQWQALDETHYNLQ